MTLLFIDGFDHYATADITKKWTAQSGYGQSIGTTGGRRGGKAISIPNFGWCYKALAASETTIIAGFAIRPTQWNSARAFVSLWEAGSVEHVCLCLDTTTGYIVARRGNVSGTILATGTTTVPVNTSTYVELKVVIATGTGGSVVTRINGVTDINVSGVTTSNGGTNVVSRFYLGTPSLADNGLSAAYDDLYVANASGSTNNNFLGDCRIDTVFPTGDGNYTQFTPSTGTAHWSLVDESTPNTTDYVSDATSGDRDSYTFPDIASTMSTTVHGVQINAAALKSDSGSRSLGTMSRLSSTDKDGAGAAMNTSQVYISEIQETDPSSAAWTVTNVNAAEFGVKVTA